MNSSSSLSISFLHWSIAAGAIPASPVPIELARVHQATKMAHFRGKIGSLLGAPLDQIGAPSSGHGHLINMQSKSRAAIEKAGQDKERSGVLLSWMHTILGPFWALDRKPKIGLKTGC